jgi:hypothetical protein
MTAAKAAEIKLPNAIQAVVNREEIADYLVPPGTPGQRWQGGVFHAARLSAVTHGHRWPPLDW